MKAHGILARACPNGDRCFECLKGTHYVRVNELTPETLEEVITMIAERLK